MDKHTQEQVNKGIMLPLMEEFYTIQGEGYHTGRAAYFIRVGGCDVGCHWCDVKESWNAELHPPTETDIIVSNAAFFGANTLLHHLVSFNSEVFISAFVIVGSLTATLIMLLIRRLTTVCLCCSMSCNTYIFLLARLDVGA